MEYGSIEREIHVNAAPDVVYEVISTPEHVRQWWPDDVVIEATAGATGHVAFGEPPNAMVVPLTVVEADPPRRFAFRWAYEQGQVAEPTNSLLVTFDLSESETGTTLRFTETGYRERGWEGAMLEEKYNEHVGAWDSFLPRLTEYLSQPVSTP